MLQVSLTRDIPPLPRLLAQGNVSLANRMLHALKGFIPIFCTDALRDQLAAIELLRKTGSAREVGAAFEAKLTPISALRLQIPKRLERFVRQRGRALVARLNENFMWVLHGIITASCL